MKKQVLIFATITAIVFTSCSKEKIEALQTNQPEEISTARGGGGGTGIVPVSNRALLGRFEFNGTLKDTMGKLEDAWPEHGRVLFGPDRKGQANKALRFNGAYGVGIYDIPYTPGNCSVSFWAKDEVIEGPSWTQMLGSSQAFTFIQNENEFNCNFQKFGYGIVQQVGTSPINGQWHHIAATRDNTSLKLYIDGVLIGTAPSSATDFGSFVLHNYGLGYGGGSFWKGSLDDVRFYGRVLSSIEITTLANQ